MRWNLLLAVGCLSLILAMFAGCNDDADSPDSGIPRNQGGETTTADDVLEDE